ncbi:MAG: LysR family transcriptional regulator [Solirubrobacteraceae bacterium]|nr:LysR family transcriptional regulator [Solirubrobacteraceae bacterium]
MLDVKRLKVLREVAAHGSFSAAAEALSYTQSAVSQQIAALEREAGTKLVERAPRGVTLTEAGSVLVRHADAILGRLDDAEAELAALAGLKGGRLRLTTFTTAGATIMPLAIASFRSRYPDVELSVTPEEPVDVLATLRSGRADISLTIDPLLERPGFEDFDFVDLLDDPMYLMLPASHPLAETEVIELADLADDDWILGATDRCPDTRILTRACQAAGFEPRIAFHTDDHLAVQGFVASGVGIAFIPDLALIAVRDDVVIRSLGGEPPFRRIQAATLAGSWESPAKRAMLDVLQEVAGSYPTNGAALAHAV